MKITLSCIGKFHHFDLARQLDAVGWLNVIYTGYPKWKLSGELLSESKIDTFPWLQVIYMSQGLWPISSVSVADLIGRLATFAHDSHVARSLDPCDVFVGLSGHNKRAGRAAKKMGARWICDRGSSHIDYQNNILREEHERWNIPFRGIPKWSICNELTEYEECDLITVPSLFAERTFLDSGISANKIRRVNYGVDLSKFSPVAVPDPSRFDVIFVGSVSLQKGIPYLVAAFRELRHPRKTMRIIGSVDPAFSSWVKAVGDVDIQFLGPIPQSELKTYISRSHVFVLPSIQDGFGMVMAQAMACGCPVIATENTGGPDLIASGENGWVIPIRNSLILKDLMQSMADDPCFRNKVANAALNRVREIGGWTDYGSKYRTILAELLHAKIKF